MKKRFPHIQQHDEKDCGAACLSMISEYYGLKLPIARCRELIKVDNMGANMYGIETGAKELGFEAESLEGDFSDLTDGIRTGEFICPFIARIINEYGFEHYIVIWKMKNGIITIGDPALMRNTKISEQMFREMWQGQIVAFTYTNKVEQKDYRKGSFVKFFKYIFNQKKTISFVIIMSLIISAVNIAGSTVFQYVTQEIQTSALSDISNINTNAIQGRLGALLEQLFPSLASVCMVVIMMYAFKSVLSVVRSKILANAMKLIDMPLTMDYYSHLLHLPAEFYGTRNTGEFMSRFDDAGKIRDAISSTVLSSILDGIMAVACGAFLCWLNVRMFFVTLVIILIYTIVTLLFVKPLKDMNHKSMTQASIVTSYLKESIDGIETIKACNYADNAEKKTYKLFNKLLDISIQGNMMASVQSSLVQFIGSAGIVALLWVGTKACTSGVMSLSELFMFYYMLSYFLNPVQSLINLQPTIQTATVAAERLNDILDAKPEKTDGKLKSADMTGDIIFDNVKFRYGNRDLVLDDLSLVFKAGEKTALVGESGCGKTTITKLLMSFYQPEDGTVTIGNTNLYDISPEYIRNKIAYISQNTFLFADTIYENLRMGASKDEMPDEEIQNVCKDCLADEFISRLPVGYDTKIEENGSNLSGGQRQRLAIARALLRKPDIIIMDEATSNLDTITEKAIQKLIDSLPSNITVIIIAHRLKTVQNCDNIYVLKNGYVAEQGTHTELLELNGLYASNWK